MEQSVERAPRPRQTANSPFWDPTAKKFLFPAFQYNAAGEVRPEMGELLAMLPNGAGGEVGFGCTSRTAVSTAPPVDAFATHAAAVIEAAVSTFHAGDSNW